MSTNSAQLDLHIKKIVDQLCPNVKEYLDHAFGAQGVLCVTAVKNHQLIIIVLRPILQKRRAPIVTLKLLLIAATNF